MYQELEAQQTGMIRPVAQPSDVIEYHKEVAKLIENALEKNVDYGVIPGTGDKPALLKPGAERLCLAFGAHAEYEIIEKEIDHEKEITWQKKKKVWNNKFKGDRTFQTATETGTSQGIYRYIYRCRIVRADGRILGEGQGSCSTLESKFIDRPRDCENTVIKMAMKRGLVAGVLNAFGLSNRFTQDVEETPEQFAPPDAQAEIKKVNMIPNVVLEAIAKSARDRGWTGAQLVDVMRRLFRSSTLKFNELSTAQAHELEILIGSRVFEEANKWLTERNLKEAGGEDVGM